MKGAINRRTFMSALSTVAAGSSLALPASAKANKARLVVIGGGFGGATAARFAKRLLPNLQVTLVEPNHRYVACPFSNLVVAGTRALKAQTFSYEALAAEGLEVVTDTATDVDTVAQSVRLSSGDSIDYDRLILAPGIDFRWNALAGYDQSATEQMPHAWKAGAQTERLRDQLAAMPDGGVVAISVTAAPFRCPPGPYERASLIAGYLQRYKPRAKLIVLDSNERFSKQPLFEDAWRRLYGDRIEWRSASNDGRVTRVDSAAMTLHTDFESVAVSVANIVPPQQAGYIAARAGTTDESGWCPVNAVSFESLHQPGIHVIGDAAIAAPMPKSAFAANAQAKVCAIAVARLLSGMEAEPTTLANTCYSFISEAEAISISGVYATGTGAFSNVPGAGGTTPVNVSTARLRQEADEARDWFAAITGQAFL